MIERVARAIKEANEGEYTSNFQAAMLARAAIKAMMEPTEEMVGAELKTKWPALYRDHLILETDGDNMKADTKKRIEAATKGYQAMIREALK